jgi:hypothetical protein
MIIREAKERYAPEATLKHFKPNRSYLHPPRSEAGADRFIETDFQRRVRRRLEHPCPRPRNRKQNEVKRRVAVQKLSSAFNLLQGNKKN